jgi:hypothetical protein
MAARRSFFKSGNYKYPFFVSLGVILVLLFFIALMTWGGYGLERSARGGLPLGAPASDPATAARRFDEKIVSIRAQSVTVSYPSAATFKEERSTFAIDADTKIYRQVPKDSATFGKEMGEFQKQLIAAARPIPAPLLYTLAPATFTDIVVGMHITVEYKPNASASATSTQIAQSIQIEPEASPGSVQSR